MSYTLRLKPGREKSVLRHHPWIFSGAVADVFGDPDVGETVDVIGSEGNILCKAAYSPRSQIRARVWTWDNQQQIKSSFFHERLVQAIAARESMPDYASLDAMRLVHAESDFLPGLIVDRYLNWLIVQFLSAGAERWRDVIIDELVKIMPVEGIFERSDVEVRNLEGLPARTGLLYGREPPNRIQIRENAVRFSIDVHNGHKTGFYLDQKDNRDIVRQLANERNVLDCFCYTGGFTLSALAGGAASVVGVDVSKEALSLAHENLLLNGHSSDRAEFVDGDVFYVLRSFRDSRQSFDLIILDPPKFAATSAQVERATRGYKDINLLGLKLLNPGGILVTFSCSGGVDEELFQKIVAGAALDAQVDAQIVRRLHQAPDHPVALSFPEGAYLKGLIVYKKAGEL